MTPQEITTGAWSENSKLVLYEIRRMNTTMEQLDKRVYFLQNEITKLQVKAGLAGAIAGFIPFLISLLLKKI